MICAVRSVAPSAVVETCMDAAWSLRLDLHTVVRIAEYACDDASKRILKL